METKHKTFIEAELNRCMITLALQSAYAVRGS